MLPRPAAILAACLVTVVWAQPVSAATCTHDQATASVVATAESEAATFSVGLLGQILLNGIPCETATVANTDRIDATGSAGTAEAIGVDLSGGHFQPGATHEATGTSEIEFVVGLEGDEGDRLSVIGTAGPDVVRVGIVGVDLTGDDDADVDGDGFARVGVHAADGDDVVVARGPVVGGPPAVPLLLDGGPGDDTMTGGPLNDQLLGGEGDDALDGRAGDDDLQGDDGRDRVDFEDAPAGVRVDLPLGTAVGWGRDLVGDIEEVRGSPGNDHLLGDGERNVLVGRAGNDRLGGDAGEDVLDGGTGKDFVRPGPGDDRVVGAGGSDTCSLRSAERSVWINLEAGVVAGQGVDQIAGVENAVGSRFPDVLRGTNEANRRLVGAGGDDRVLGLGGADRLRGGQGDDDLWGGPGDDHLAGTGDDDRLRGGRDDDLLSGGSGTDDCIQNGGSGRYPGCESAR